MERQTGRERALALLKGGKPDQATKHFKQGLAYRQEMAKHPEATADANYGMGGSYSSLGRVLFRDDSKQNEALEYFEKAVKHRKEFSDANPDIGLARREYGGALTYRGITKRGIGQHEGAVQDLQTAVSILEEVLAKWKKKPGLQGEHGNASDAWTGKDGLSDDGAAQQ